MRRSRPPCRMNSDRSASRRRSARRAASASPPWDPLSASPFSASARLRVTKSSHSTPTRAAKSASAFSSAASDRHTLEPSERVSMYTSGITRCTTTFTAGTTPTREMIERMLTRNGASRLRPSRACHSAGRVLLAVRRSTSRSPRCGACICTLRRIYPNLVASA